MSVEYKDYYKILGVSRSASQEEIGKAYKKLARKHHPDLNHGDKGSEERFKEVNEAHEVLKDPEKRKLYDHLGPNWQDGQNFQRPPGFENMHFTFGGGGFGASGFSDFFETLFGRGGGFQTGSTHFSGAGSPFGGGFEGFAQQQRKGRDVEANLSLSLEDAFRGGIRNLTLQVGGGQGSRSLEVNIPAGVKNGQRIRLAGQGDTVPGGAPGNLFLRVNILPNPHFTLDDADVLYDLSLAPWEAALGCKVQVPTLSGKVELSIAPGTSSGKKLRLRGKGLGSGSGKGDQIVRVNIVVPDSTTPEVKELWNKLRDLTDFKAREAE